jgi:hypothetical protein
MENVILKKTSLKEFVDFAFSLKEMEEVKKNNFPIPESVTFKLDDRNHTSLQKEVLEQKKITTKELSEVFELEVYGITFIFTK